jgi:hypothetical protein
MKHFMKHHNVRNINYECIAIEKLIKYSKKFTECANGIVHYIDETAEKNFMNRNDGKLKKNSITRERDAILNKCTKCIPGMTFKIETFNCMVVKFDKCARTTFQKLLHQGEVRDFHIKNKLLQQQQQHQQTPESQSQMINDDDDENSNDSTINDDSNDEERENHPPQKGKKRGLQTSIFATDSESNESESENEVTNSSENESINDESKAKVVTRRRLVKNVDNAVSKGKKSSSSSAVAEGATTRAATGRRGRKRKN